jgi:translation initiation factor IF-3
LRTKPKFHQQAPRYRINHQIQAAELRVLDEEGRQLGVLTKSQALSKAEELQADLVEIAPAAKPPVAKIIDYKKFLYQLSKKKRQSGKQLKSGDIKEMWLTPFMAENDLEVRVSRGKELLDESGKLKIVMRFRRPQMSRREFGQKTMEKYIGRLGDVSVEKPPRFEGMRLIASVSKK